MIEVKALTKRYGSVEAVKGVSFSVGAEQVLGFLGPNGAGKTTIMKILTGYHYPSSGEAFVNGLSVQEKPCDVKAVLGYLPEGVPLYGELTVDEYIDWIALARGIPSAERKAKINAALESAGLVHMRSRRIETLSKGYKQRTGLAAAIVHDPPILILDEPTTGLDPNQIIEIRSLIKELGKRKTVILSTHILQEVEAVCNQVLIINDGRIAAQGTPEEIALSLKGGVSWKLKLKAESETAIKNVINAIEKAQKDSGIVEKEANSVFNVSFFVNRAEDAHDESVPESIFDWAVSNNFKILGMAEEKLTLEDIFVKLTSENTGSHGVKTGNGGKNG